MSKLLRVTTTKWFGFLPMIKSVRITEKAFLTLDFWTKIPFLILPSLLLLAAVPWGLALGSSLASDVFKSTNFTLTSHALTVLTAPQSAELAKSADGYTNVMLVGIDTRPNRKGADLQNTDTIMLLSYNHKTNKLTMISFPRDLIVNYPTYGAGKINGVYGSAERAKKGSGLKALTKVIGDMTGQSIQYYAMINLDGFRKTIDLLGGITVTVDNAFTDYAYPTDLYGYQVVSFKTGKQKMNGERALEYARSRHAAGVEGSDFSRARRQQKVIEAVIAKFRSTETLQNPLKVYDILKAMINNVQTSAVTPGDVQAGLNILKEQGDSLQITTVVLDPLSGNGTLVHAEMGQFGYQIVPNKGMDNWTAVKAFVKKELAKSNQASTTPTPTPKK